MYCFKCEGHDKGKVMFHSDTVPVNSNEMFMINAADTA